MLHKKGHSKDQSSDRLYHTSGNYIVIVKALDTNIATIPAPTLTSLLAFIKAEHCFCTPILLIEMSSLVIYKAHVTILETHFKGSLKYALRLSEDTSDLFVYLIFGSLPSVALIHLRLFSLVLQLNRLDLCHSSFGHAVYKLQSKPLLR